MRCRARSVGGAAAQGWPPLTSNTSHAVHDSRASPSANQVSSSNSSLLALQAALEQAEGQIAALQQDAWATTQQAAADRGKADAAAEHLRRRLQQAELRAQQARAEAHHTARDQVGAELQALQQELGAERQVGVTAQQQACLLKEVCWQEQLAAELGGSEVRAGMGVSGQEQGGVSVGRGRTRQDSSLEGF